MIPLDSLASSAGGSGVLTPNLKTPEVSETSVSSDLLQTFQVLTELVIKLVDEEVRVLAVNDVTLSVEEPSRDLVLFWVLNDGDDSLELFDSKFTGSLAEVDVGLLADQVGVSPANTTDGGQGVHDLDLTVNVGGQKTQNVLEVTLLGDDE